MRCWPMPEASGTPIDGPDGLLAQITKSVLERALEVEIAEHPTPLATPTHWQPRPQRTPTLLR